MKFEPVGRWYESYGSHVKGISCSSTGSTSDDEDDLWEGGDGADGEVNPLLLDPTQWKVSCCAHVHVESMWSCDVVYHVNHFQFY